MSAASAWKYCRAEVLENRLNVLATIRAVRPIDEKNMKNSRSCGTDSRIYADFVDLGGIVSKILDVSQNMAFPILTNHVSKDGTNGEVDRGGLDHWPVVHGEILD